MRTRRGSWAKMDLCLLLVSHFHFFLRSLMDGKPGSVLNYGSKNITGKNTINSGNYTHIDHPTIHVGTEQDCMVFPSISLSTN